MTQVVVAATGLAGIPVCDGSSTSPALSNKSEFQTFFRPLPPDNMQARAVIDFMKNQGWRQFAIIASEDAYGQNLAESTRDLADESIKHITTQNYFADAADWKTIVSNLRDTDATIFVFFGQPGELRGLLKEARAQGILEKGYAWITTDAIQSLGLSEYTAEELDNLNGVINTFPSEGK
ncbi:hypothetical protein HK102_010665, partial [Quaeritorhiza haematococci]